MEVWNGDGWSAYADVDNVLRHGVRLTEEQAIVLLLETRDRLGTRAPFSAEEQRMALHDRLRRA